MLISIILFVTACRGVVRVHDVLILNNSRDRGYKQSKGLTFKSSNFVDERQASQLVQLNSSAHLSMVRKMIDHLYLVPLFQLIMIMLCSSAILLRKENYPRLPSHTTVGI